LSVPFLTNIKHIFFDLDHTLWDFHANSLEALAELYLMFELEERAPKFNSDFFIERYVFHNERMWAMYREDKMSKSRLRKARFEYALRDMRIEDKSSAKEIGNAYLEICPRKTKLNDGAIEVLEALKDHYNLHILSNGFHETQLIKLEQSGLMPYFQQIITSEKAAAKKPNRRMFDYAQVHTGAMPKETLMIGDNLEIDVIGALDYGWDAIHYNTTGIRHEYKSVQTLLEIPGLLFK